MYTSSPVYVISQESQRSIAEKVPLGENSYKHRRDIVFSQAVTTVVTCAVFKFLQSLVNKLFVAQLVEIGFLCHWESLLSTIGSEYGMLEDFIVAIHDLNNMKLKVRLVAVGDGIWGGGDWRRDSPGPSCSLKQLLSN